MTGKASRDRGARCERVIVNYLRANGFPDARRVLAGDGRQHSDIEFHPLISLEAKDVARSAWPSWCRQAVAQAHPGTVPVVVRRVRGETNVGRWPARFAFAAAAEVGLPIGAVYVGSVDGEPWCEAYFADVVAAVRELDA